MNNNYYTVREVAEFLRISVTTVRRHIASDSLRATRLGKNGQLRISREDLAAFLGNDEKAESHLPEIALPAPQVVIREGVIDDTNHWKVINGDILSGLKEIPENSIDCVVTSPPYYWQRDYEVAGQIGHEPTIEGYVKTLTAAFHSLRRVMKDTGTFFLNLGDTYYSAKGRPHGNDDKHSGRKMMRRMLRAVDGPGLGIPRKSLIGIPWRVAISMQEDGWTLRSNIIWSRPASLPEPTAKDRPWRTFEHIFLFTKSPKYFFNRIGLGDEEDIWHINSRPENPGAHFAPYPRELVDRCLECGCPENGVVLDPFCGSGTTLVSAISHGHSAVGIELKQEYAHYSIERILKEKTKHAKQ